MLFIYQYLSSNVYMSNLIEASVGITLSLIAG